MGHPWNTPSPGRSGNIIVNTWRIDWSHLDLLRADHGLLPVAWDLGLGGRSSQACGPRAYALLFACWLHTGSKGSCESTVAAAWIVGYLDVLDLKPDQEGGSLRHPLGEGNPKHRTSTRPSGVWTSFRKTWAFLDPMGHLSTEQCHRFTCPPVSLYCSSVTAAESFEEECHGPSTWTETEACFIQNQATS